MEVLKSNQLAVTDGFPTPSAKTGKMKLDPLVIKNMRVQQSDLMPKTASKQNSGLLKTESKERLALRKSRLQTADEGESPLLRSGSRETLGKQKKYVLVLDLDETLVHFKKNPYDNDIFNKTSDI